jgi:hypothetical protein
MTFPTTAALPRIAVLVVSLGVLAGCAGTPSEPSPTRHSFNGSTVPRPSPTPSTIAEENALASKVPLNGNSLVPLHWRLPSIKGSDAAAVLAARRATAVDDLIYSIPSNAAWAGTQFAVEQISSDLYKLYAQDTLTPWKKLSAGPVWIWIMNVHRETPDRLSIHQCTDSGWNGSAGGPGTKKRDRDGSVERLVVTRLSHYPDGARWKVTDRDYMGDTYASRQQKNQYPKTQYQKQCKAWTATHTTTGGWTLPSEPTNTP